MRLAIDATNIGPGGGITGLSYYLGEWVKMGRPEEIIIWASIPAVLSRFDSIGSNIRVEPFMVDKSSPARFLASRFFLARKIEKVRPDVLMTTLRMLPNCRIPQVVHHRNLWWQIHESFLTNFRKYGLQKAVRYLTQKRSYYYALRHSAANAYISRYMCELANAQYPPAKERNYPVQNGGLQCPFSDEEKDFEINRQRKPVIVAVQSDGEYKQSDLLLYMLREIKSRMPDVPWKLIIIGTVYQPENFQNLIDELDCRENVELTGYLPSVRIHDYFRNAFCHVLPSRLEGFGNTPLEAMAMGCPVVSSDCTAIPEVVGDAGILVPADDPKAFANGVMELYNNPDLRKGCIKKGFMRVKEFSWTKSARLMYEIFCKAAGRKTGE